MEAWRPAAANNSIKGLGGNVGAHLLERGGSPLKTRKKGLSGITKLIGFGCFLSFIISLNFKLCLKQIYHR
jgi:hypothetical protein